MAEIKKINVYGAGYTAHHVLPAIKTKLTVEYIFDRDTKKHGSDIFGIPVVELTKENVLNNPVLLLLDDIIGAIGCLNEKGKTDDIYFFSGTKWHQKISRYTAHTSDIAQSIEMSGKDFDEYLTDLLFEEIEHGEYLSAKGVSGMPDYTWRKIFTQTAPGAFSEVGIKHIDKSYFDTVDGIRMKTMITAEEMSYLYYLAKKEFSGEGFIADLGPLLGSSTYSFARGLKNNKDLNQEKRLKKIYSFDLFPHYDFWMDEESETGSCFEQYFSLIKNYKEYIHISPGDICDFHWGDRKIEILFIDLAKNWDINNHVVREFFPFLIPGKSVLIQQDYLHQVCFWLHITMELLKDYFVLEDFVSCSAVYRLKKELPADIKEFDLRKNYTDAQLIKIHEDIVEKSPDSIKRVLMLAHARLLHAFGQEEQCHKIIDVLRKPVCCNKYALNPFIDYTHRLANEILYADECLSR